MFARLNLRAAAAALALLVTPGLFASTAQAASEGCNYLRAGNLEFPLGVLNVSSPDGLEYFAGEAIEFRGAGVFSSLRIMAAGAAAGSVTGPDGVDLTVSASGLSVFTFTSSINVLGLIPTISCTPSTIPPTVDSVTPLSGPVAGGTPITLSGTRFTDATSVTFGGIAATDVRVINSSTITAVVPPHAAGTVAIAVTTPDGTGSRTGAFTFSDPATTTMLTSSRTPSTFGESVTFTATVTGAQAPTGAVEFRDGATSLGQATLTTIGVTPSISTNAASDHTCAITGAGGLQCWGSNVHGVTTVPADLGPVSAVATGTAHTCALTPAGAVRCWGYNADGQTTVPADLGPATAIALGVGHSCALTTAAVRCWGSNVDGQATVPADLGPVTAVTGGGGRTCALTSAAAVRCWGYNTSGQSTVPTDLGPATAIAAGDAHTCALTTAAAVRCWGYNSDGRTTVPADLGLATAIAVGNEHSCAIAEAAALRCWGSNTNGQTDVPPELGPVAAVAAGFRHTCALTPAGAIRCWGYNNLNQTAVPAGLVAAVRAKAALSTAALGVGSHTITAAYGGDANHSGSTSAPLTQAVNPAATAIMLTSSRNPSTFGEAITFTATVTSDAGTPTGDVRFTETAAGMVLGTATLANGVATLSTAALPVGSFSITAEYFGNVSFAGSSTSSLTQVVAAIPTTMVLSSSSPAATVGQPVTFTATVTPSPTDSPASTVTFQDGATVLGSGSLTADGAATLTTTALAAGAHSITATYDGSASFGASSDTLVQRVAKTPTSTALTAKPNPARPGQTVRLTATVSLTPPATEPVSGTVTFRAGNRTLGTGPVTDGAATLGTTDLAIGDHTVTATFAATPILRGSSATETVSVDPRVGPEFKVNTFTARDQQQPAVAALPNGSFVVAWRSEGQDEAGTGTSGENGGIYLQRHQANGKPAGKETRVNTTTANDQSQPAVAVLADGGFVVTWRSSARPGIKGRNVFAQRFAATGKPAGDEFRVNTTTADLQAQPAVAGLANGGFVVTWRGRTRASGSEIFAQLHDATGARLGGEMRVNTTTAGDQMMPAVAPLASGGFVVVWTSLPADPTQTDSHVLGQLYQANGTKAWPEFTVSMNPVKPNFIPAVTGLPGGGFMVAWMASDHGANGNGIFARRYPAPGQPNPQDVVRVNTTTRDFQGQPVIAAFHDGTAIVAWSSSSQDGDGRGVYAQMFDAFSQPRDVEFRLNTTTAGDQSQPDIATLATGNFVATWASWNQDGSGDGVIGQRFRIILPAAATTTTATVTTGAASEP